MNSQTATHTLSADGMTLTIRQPVQDGERVITLHRLSAAGPFTDADIALALAQPVSGSARPGQRNRTSRIVTRFGTVWTHLMLGPPTWWLPKVTLDEDGTVMAGWLRAAAAVKFSRERKSG